MYSMWKYLCSFSYTCVSACLHRVCCGSFWGELPAAVRLWERRSVWQTDGTLQLQGRLDWRALWARWVSESEVTPLRKYGHPANSCTVETTLTWWWSAVFLLITTSNWHFPVRSVRSRTVWCRLYGAVSVRARRFLSSCDWRVPVSAGVEGKTLRQRYKTCSWRQY